MNNAANIEDRIEFHVFDRFTVQNAIIGAASTQTINGDLVLNGKLFGELDVPSINTGIATVTELDVNGKGDISGDLNVVGVTTLAKAIIGTGVTIDQSNIDTVGIITASTFVGNFTGNPTGTIQTAAQPNITSLGTLSSLNVSGNVSIGGTLTYEDVTSIDSVGLITARSGMVVSGVSTFAGAINANGGVTGDVTGDLTGDVTGNVTGNVSGTSGSTTGNAATATKLATARTIGGVSFDGSQDIDLPGDKLTFNDFSLRFLVDEDLENYNEIQKWMRGMGFPESLEEIYKFQKSDPNAPQDNKRLNLYSDGTLNV